jgi:ArsR family transcriptional regulator
VRNADIKVYTALLKAMAHPMRLEILKRLLKGPCCANTTNKKPSISQPNLSQHLGALRRANLIGFEKKGVQRCYFLRSKERIEMLFTALNAFKAK